MSRGRNGLGTLTGWVLLILLWREAPPAEEMKASARAGTATYFASVEVLDDGEVQVLLALPFGLHGVGQELPEGPMGPFQQLIIQQERVGSL